MKEVTRDGMFVVERVRLRLDAPDFEAKSRAMFEDWNRISTPEKMLNDLRGQVVKALKVKPPALARKSRKADKRRMEARERREKDLQYILKEIDWLLRTHKESSRNHVDFFNLGMLACRANMRLIEPAALSGMAFIKKGVEGNKERTKQAEKKWDVWLKDPIEIRKKEPDRARSDIAKELSKRYKGNPLLANKYKDNPELTKKYEGDPELFGKPDTIDKKLSKLGFA